MRHLDEILSSCTVKLSVSSGNSFGTGFFVAEKFILTCFHVVKGAGFDGINVEWKDFSKSDLSVIRFEAKIENFSREADLALLRWEEGLSDHPCVYLDEEVEGDDRLHIFGYSDNYSNGGPVNLECEGLTGDKLPFIKCKGGQIRPGHSGSPILNRRTGKVCGIIKFTDGKNDLVGGGGIPASTIFGKFNQLIPCQHIYHRSHPQWLKAMAKSNLGIIKPPFYHNLPPRDYLEFIGRKEELNTLSEFLSPERRPYILTVYGIGGVGKTALVLEVAHLCREVSEGITHIGVPLFDAIIFTSAKLTWLSAEGILQRPKWESSLGDIFTIISRTLNDRAITEAPPNEQLSAVYDALRRQRTLLIVDNMETIQDEVAVVSFLQSLPEGSKAIITTRKQITLHALIQLGDLSETESLHLIQQQTKEKKINLNSKQARRLYSRFGGNPAALIYAVGQWASGFSPKRILNPTAKIPEDIAKFCFEGSLKSLSISAYHLMLSLGIFRGAPTLEPMTSVAGLRFDPIAAEKGLRQLKILSIVIEREGQFRTLTVTREYIAAKLAADTTNFEELARERWIDWYKKLAQKYGGLDWEGWAVQYDHLDHELTNFLGVLHWCESQERYVDVRDIWENIDNYVDLYGHWQGRLYWLTWLISQAERQADFPTKIGVMYKKGWAMTLIGGQYITQAATILAEAWRKRYYVEPSVQSQIAHAIAGLKLTLGQYKQAKRWLIREEDLINQAQLDSRLFTRYLTQIFYYRAEIDFQECNFDQAKQLFEKVLEQSRDIKWQRFENYATNYLAEIAIQEGNRTEADKLIRHGLSIAESNNERRRIAHFKASQARLEQLRGNSQEACKLAKEALDSFRYTGINREANEMRLLLESLENAPESSASN